MRDIKLNRKIRQVSESSIETKVSRYIEETSSQSIKLNLLSGGFKDF